MKNWMLIVSVAVLLAACGGGSGGGAGGSGSAAVSGGSNGVASNAGNGSTSSPNLTKTDLAALAAAPTSKLSLFAGNAGSVGSTDGKANVAKFNFPNGVAVDASGNVYVADQLNNTVRLITPAGVVSTIAGTPGLVGSADGIGSAASFNGPAGAVVDSAGNVYVTDIGNLTIRKLTPNAGVYTVSTYAGVAGSVGSVDGVGPAASFCGLFNMAIDQQGNLYVTDCGNIRLITPTQQVTTLATGGYPTYSGALALATDNQGNLYETDYNNTVNLITLSAGTVTGVIFIAGNPGVYGNADGVGKAATFFSPCGIVFDNNTGDLFVTSSTDVRRIMPGFDGAIVTTIAGDPRFEGFANGVGSAARFFNLNPITIDGNGKLYTTDSNNNVIRTLTPKVESQGTTTYTVATLAGVPAVSGAADGTKTAAQFSIPIGLTTDANGNIYVADAGDANTVRMITPAGVVSTLAGTYGYSGNADGVGAAARFNFGFFQQVGLAADNAGNLYVSDPSNHTVRVIALATNTVTTIAGSAGVAGSADGIGTAASFNNPLGIALDGLGNLYISDSGNGTLRQLNLASGQVVTVAGTVGTHSNIDGVGTAATFNQPAGLATDTLGNLYVVDSSNNTVRLVQLNNNFTVTTLAGIPGKGGNADGAGTTATFRGPRAVAVDTYGNLVVSDPGNNTIRLIKPTFDGPVVSTIVGSTSAGTGFVAGSLPGRIVFPYGLAASGSTLYIATENGIASVSSLP